VLGQARQIGQHNYILHEPAISMHARQHQRPRSNADRDAGGRYECSCLTAEYVTHQGPKEHSHRGIELSITREDARSHDDGGNDYQLEVLFQFGLPAD
jgi:hypothetical protein